jgi:hypothetical protein
MLINVYRKVIVTQARPQKSLLVSLDIAQTFRGIGYLVMFFENDISSFFITVRDNKSRNIPKVVLVRRWAVGVLGIWREGVGWVKGGANGVSLQAT